MFHYPNLAASKTEKKIQARAHRRADEWSIAKNLNATQRRTFTKVSDYTTRETGDAANDVTLLTLEV